MVIILVGRMASGKTTLAKALEERGYKRIITYTTRKARKGEVNNLDYHFISRVEFKRRMQNGFFAEFSKQGDNYYGSALSHYGIFEEDGDPKRVVVLDPAGVISLCKSPIEARIVWLDLPEDILMQRALSRGEIPESINQRFIEEQRGFERLEAGKLYDIRVREELPVQQLVELAVGGQQ